MQRAKHLFPHASLSSDTREFWRAKQYIQHFWIVTIKISGTLVEKKNERVFSKTGYFSLSFKKPPVRL